MINVVFIIDGLRVGGAEKHTVWLANELKRSGYFVEIICLKDERRLEKELVDDIAVSSLKKRHFFDLRAIIALKNILEKKEDFIVISVGQGPMLYAYFARILSKQEYKIIVSLHIAMMQNFFKEMRNYIMNLVMSRVDCVLFVCQAQKEYWVKKYRLKLKKTVVIHNSVSLNIYNKTSYDKTIIRRQLGIKDEEIVLGVNAVLRKEKRHEDLISAGRILWDQGYGVKLFFIGDGYRRKFLSEQAEKMYVKDNLIVTGFVDNVAKYLSVVDIAVLCSAVETFSLAILECMAMRKPIVMTDIGGAREQVEPGKNGYLYTPKDVEGLVLCIKRIIDEDLFEDFGNRSFEKVKTMYVNEISCQKYMDFIGEMESDFQG